MNSIPRSLLSLIAFATVLLGVIPTRSSAIPAFARRYNVTCYACHTIAPVVNEAGYMFRRLGYRLAPSLQEGKRAPTISELSQSEPVWTVASTASFAVTDVGYSASRSTQEGTAPTSTSSFELNSWNAYWSGSIPDSNFSYYSEFDIASAGAMTTTLSNAYFGYTGGSANSSWFIDAGRQHLQVAEGTRASALYSLLPNSPLLFETQSPTTFIFDQSPMGVELGYTYASPNYRNIVGLTMKVTNGDNADGSEILGGSNSGKNGKDLWLDVDWWFAPESGISLVGYYGRKYQNQVDNLNNPFTYKPTIRRLGVFANYMILPVKVDLLAGYLSSRDDWQNAQIGPTGVSRGNDCFVEADYYIRTGFAVVCRYDRVRQEVFGGPGRQSTKDWSAGLERAFTPSGNIIGRVSFTDMIGTDPVTATRSTSRSLQTDISLNF